MSAKANNTLMVRLGHPHSEILYKILTIAVTPEEASLLLLLPCPVTELAEKLVLDESSIEDKLKSFERRGLIRPSRHGLRFPRNAA